MHCVPSDEAAIAYVHGEGEYADRVAFPYPTLIITDLQMPAGDGYALLRTLQSQSDPPSCSVVIFSSMDDEDHIAKARQQGVNTYIVKPITLEGTCRALRMLFPQH